MTAAPSKSRRAILLHRLTLAAALLVVEILAARGLASFDPGARLLGGEASTALSIFVLGAFFCLRFLVYFLVPPALAVGLVAPWLPKVPNRESRAHDEHPSKGRGAAFAIDQRRPEP